MIERFEKFSYAIFEISRCWHKIAADELEEYGLKGAYATYLTTLYRHPEGITAARLTELCGRDKADVSRAMAVLESKGLLLREGASYRALLKLTEEGCAAAEHVCRRAALVVEKAGRQLTEEQRENFYQALDLIGGSLRQISRDGLPRE